MNSVPFIDTTAIPAAFCQISNYATNHFRRLSSVRLLKFELWLPEGVQDEENRLFLAFAESFRQFLASDRLFPFCLWLRDQVGGRMRYLCAWFLGDFSSDLVEGYFKVAECIWKKTLGFRKDQGAIRWFQETAYGRPLANGAKIKQSMGEDQPIIDACNQWLNEMRQRAYRIPDPRRGLLTFGAVHQY